MSNIKIRVINYKGWQKTVEISNSEIKLLISPETGRILFFGFKNSENIFYENNNLEGVTFNNGHFFKVNGKKESPNIGGNRILPCSEEHFHRITGSRHLPDPCINASSYKVTKLQNGIILKSPISKLLGIEITRTITISENGSEVKIQQKLKKIKSSNNSELEKIPLTIWSLSKIRTPNFSFVPIYKNSCFKDGYTISEWPDAKNNAADNVSIKDGILSFKSSKKLPQKIGTDSRNWVAGYLDNNLFIEKFSFEENQNYPDFGTSVTIFGNHLFSELECLSPEKTLGINESINYDLTWSLIKIKTKKEAKLYLQNL